LALICLTGFIFVPFYGITAYNLSFGD
jgi:hypothetical protein